MSIRENLQKVLDTYLNAKQGPHGKQNELFNIVNSALNQIIQELKALDEIKKRE